MLYRFILQSIWDWRVMQVKSLLYFVIFSVSLCQRKFNSCDFLLSYLDLEQFWLLYPSVKWRRWTTLLWVDACSTKIPSHYDMAVQNHQATNCGTAKGHIHKLCRFFLNPFLFSQTFCSPEFIECSKVLSYLGIGQNGWGCHALIRPNWYIPEKIKHISLQSIKNLKCMHFRKR